MTMLIHSQDHAWQASLLPKLQRLGDANKIDGSEYALLVDKERVSRGKPQLYGTQFKFENNAMTMYAVEDPTGLDARRAKVMLMPVEAYKEMLSSEYHMKTTDGGVARSK
jgi:hypothetical protein